ncbi:MAG: NAD(+) diphosphatase [Treponema sp.]|nr:NAD(+) diphosphatase [Treponema sp.]
MIQDILPYKLNNQFVQNVLPCENDKVMIFSKGQVMACLEKGSVTFPTVKASSEHGISTENLIYLFSISNEEGIRESYFLYEKTDVQIPGFEFTEVRQIRDTEMDFMYKVMAMMTAKHLADWYRDTKFCGRCGCKTVHSKTERAMVCTDEKCGYTMYPRIMPAVIVGVINGDKLLLTKYRNGYANNALVAGFTEIGETLEETVAREVMEETGLKVKNIRYYKSQPWGLANDILTGFYCDVDGDTTIRMDENELKEAAFVKREDIILQPTKVSLTNEMMMRFKDGSIT